MSSISDKLPPHIHPQHWQEWVIDSAINPELTSLNLHSLEGTNPYEYLLYSDKLPRRNDGRLSEGFLKHYRHLENGGWWCGGVNPLTGEESLWGCFKPNNPRIDPEKDKSIKYEHPPKVETELFCLKIPVSLGWKIAQNFNQEEAFRQRFFPKAGDSGQEAGGRRQEAEGRRQEAGGRRQEAEEIILSSPSSAGLYLNDFWAWIVEIPEIPLIITEGAKKAAAILSAGFPAIALPGIFNGYRQPKDENGQKNGHPRLIPQLEIFANPERKIVFAFDQDTKPKTIYNLNQAIKTTAHLLEKRSCHCYIATWMKQYKGADDLIVAKGEIAFEEAIADSKPLALWQVSQLKQLTYPVSQEIDPNLRYLPDLDLPDYAKFIAIKARKGRGKTKQIARIVEKAIKKGHRALILSHRRQLVDEICHRCGINTVTEWRNSETGRILGYGLCVDSLRRDCQAAFNPADWEDAVVIIDEVEQVFWHLLNAETEVKKHRVEILRNFRQLIRHIAQSEAGKIIISDADLSDVSIDYVQKLLEFPLEPYIIHQPTNPEAIHPSEQWNITNYPDTSPKRLITDLIADIRAGGKPFICVSAQKTQSKYGTRNLEATLRQLFPKQKILRIDSESISNPKHPAYGCIAHLNEILPQYDIVLASPSIETGVSIDLKGHFTSVWAIAGGISADNAACQAFSRVRENVPRYLWIAKSSFFRVGNGSTSVNELLFSQNRQTDANLRLLLQSEDWELEAIDTHFQPPSLLCWAKLAVRVNLGMIAYRASILEALREEGHRIRDVGKDFDEGGVKLVDNQLKETKITNYQAYCQAVSDQPLLTQSQHQELSRKQNLTEEERWQLKKTSLSVRYATEDISPEIVAEDEKGLYPALKLHYYLTVGRNSLKQRDRTILEGQLKRGKGALWQPDFNESQWGAKVWLLEFLKLPELLTKEQVHKDDSDLLELEATAKACSQEIRQILGITIIAENSPIVIYRKLLRLLGVRKLEKLGRFGERGNQHHVYANPDFGERQAIFSRWLALEATIEPLSPLSLAMQLLSRLELPARAFSTVEASVSFLQKVEGKLLAILPQVEEVGADFSSRFWEAVISLTPSFGN